MVVLHIDLDIDTYIDRYEQSRLIYQKSPWKRGDLLGNRGVEIGCVYSSLYISIIVVYSISK